MAATSTERGHRHRERVRAGIIVLPVAVDEVRLVAVLQDAGLVGDDPDRTELAEVVARWIDQQATRYSQERWRE